MTKSGKTHRLIASSQTVHTGFFDAALPPVLTIESGDTVVMNSLMLMDGRLRCGMSLEELITARRFYADRQVGPHTLTGPIFVRGAEPGDVLAVQIHKLLLADAGVNYHFPGEMGIGSLPEDFPTGQMKAFQLDLEKMETVFSQGIVLPLKPFFGVMGVAPRAGEKRTSSVPDYFGGNGTAKYA
jgi:acetamidase/formamidase